ncbi:hypothetical protein [Parenemella sanctibonifatiensis]|nr:hypothetical protein [Parenemella sanctibonifatiensis]
MSVTQQEAAPVVAPPAYRYDSAADRFMRRLLRVQGKNRLAADGAHRAYRTSLIVSGIRCLITYLLIPVLVPVLNLSNAVAAPVGILLCAVAVVSGIAGVRRFWQSDHKGRWGYTAFMAVIFVILAVGLVADIARVAA